jgi:hypothetical protein
LVFIGESMPSTMSPTATLRVIPEVRRNKLDVRGVIFVRHTPQWGGHLNKSSERWSSPLALEFTNEFDEIFR